MAGHGNAVYRRLKVDDAAYAFLAYIAKHGAGKKSIDGILAKGFVWSGGNPSSSPLKVVGNLVGGQERVELVFRLWDKQRE